MSDGEAKKEEGSEEDEKEDVQVENAEGSDEEDSYGDDEDEEDGEEGYQGNDLAYKSVEIDDNLMKEELYMLRALIWKVLENINN
jgi:hypothetical protein